MHYLLCFCFLFFADAIYEKQKREEEEKRRTDKNRMTSSLLQNIGQLPRCKSKNIIQLPAQQIKIAAGLFDVIINFWRKRTKPSEEKKMDLKKSMFVLNEISA